MNTITRDEKHGSSDWRHMRKSMFGASEASAMLGLSPYVTRNELLHRKATGVEKEYDDWFQANVLDKGHEVEALAKPFIEQQQGIELYQQVLSSERLICSTDGLTLEEHPIAWECKQWSEALADSVLAGMLPEHHQPQCQQTLMLSGARVLIFTVSDGTEAGTISMEVHPDPEWFERIRAGWARFAIDLDNYVAPEPEVPKPVGRTMASLPALRVEIEGRVTTSNLAAWREHALECIAGVNRKLETDQDFADAENAKQWCETVEKRCLAAKEHMLSQTASIDDALKQIEQVSEAARQLRLAHGKLIDARKLEIKSEVIAGGVASLRAFMAELNVSVTPYAIREPAHDFNGAAKNKRNLDSLRNAVDTELARVKIEATNLRDRMRAGILLIESRPEFAFLFNDSASLILKPADDLALLIKSRISDHEAEQERQREAERAKIRAEEQAKAEAAARAQAAEILRQEREKLEADAAQRRRVEVAEALERQAQADADAADRRRQDAEALVERQKAEADLKKLGQSAGPVAAPASGPASAPISTHAETYYSTQVLAATPPAVEEHAWINITKMNEAFGFAVTSDFIVNTLGFQWTRTEKAAKFWTPTQFEAIKRKMAAHVLDAFPIPF